MPQSGRQSGLFRPSLSPEARERLLAHPWPGNVRELKATLVRIAFLAQKPLVSAADVELALSLPMDGTPTVKAAAALPAATAQADARSTDLDFKANTKRFQRELILQVLAQTHGNKSRAAQRLGITPNTWRACSKAKPSAVKTRKY